jgi:hypothetical protein
MDLNKQLNRYDNGCKSGFRPIELDTCLAGQIGLASRVSAWWHDWFVVPASWAERTGG